MATAAVAGPSSDGHAPDPAGEGRAARRAAPRSGHAG
jgi:hypothetical protein